MINHHLNILVRIAVFYNNFRILSSPCPKDLIANPYLIAAPIILFFYEESRWYPIGSFKRSGGELR